MGREMSMKRHFSKGRRSLVLAGAFSYALQSVPRVASGEEGNSVAEEQRGDIAMTPELLQYNRDKIGIANSAVKGSFAPIPANFRDRLVAEALNWVGRNRQANMAEISMLLNLFNLPYARGGKPLPFCAAGLSYIAATVYVKASPSPDDTGLGAVRAFLPELDHAHFYPTPSVNDMVLVAQGKHRWTPAQAVAHPDPGTVVVYSWSGKGFDHVGLVKSAGNAKITTIEFNTSSTSVPGSEKNGGCVEVKNREYPSKYVRGFIVP